MNDELKDKKKSRLSLPFIIYNSSSFQATDGRSSEPVAGWSEVTLTGGLAGNSAGRDALRLWIEGIMDTHQSNAFSTLSVSWSIQRRKSSSSFRMSGMS